MIGLSFYPDGKNWQKELDLCVANMTDLATRYHKDVLISEVGFDVNQPEVTKDLLTQLIQKCKTIPSHRQLGIFYWEPEGYTKHYDKIAWQTDGKPTVALEGFSSK